MFQTLCVIGEARIASFPWFFVHWLSDFKVPFSNVTAYNQF